MQGLIPRATELAKLGGSFWVSFYPFIGVVIAAFVVLYLVSSGVTAATGRCATCMPLAVIWRRSAQVHMDPHQTEAHMAAWCFLQFTGSGFIHQGNSRMQVPEYLDRSLFSDEPTQQQTEAEAPVQGTSGASASDAEI